MDEKELNAYTQGVKDGVNLRNFPYGKDCYLFGYKLYEVLDILSKHKAESLKVIDIIDEAKVEIRRNGKIIYREGANINEAT